MERLISEAQKEGIFLRLLGGLAVKVHSPHANHRSLERKYPTSTLSPTKPALKSC